MTKINNNIEISDAEVMAVLNRCMKEMFDEEYIAKKEARKAKRAAQRQADFEECINFCERAKDI